MKRVKASADLFTSLSEPDELLANMLLSFAQRREVTSYIDFSKTTKVPLIEDPTKFNYYDPQTDRVQFLLLSILDENKYDQYVWGSVPQFAGKTQAAIIIPALRDLIDRRVNIGYGLPNLTDLDKAWSDKIKPAIEESGFGHLLPEKGPGARGGRAPSIRFEDQELNELLGRLIFLTPNAYSSTVACAFLDELDQLRKNGEPYRKGMENIFARANTAGDAAIKIAVGTYEHDHNSLLDQEIKAGTHHRLAPQCPHCKDHFLFEFEHFSYNTDKGEDGAAESARIACTACGVLLDEEERKEAINSAIFMSKDQEWQPGVGLKGETKGRNFSLRTHALDCVRADMGVIAVRMFQAQLAIEEFDDHDRARGCAHYLKCETYTDDLDADLAGLSIDLSRAELHRKSQKATYAMHECPEGFTYAVLGIDVQHSRTYFVLSVFSDDQCADIDYGFEMFCEYKQTPTLQQKFDGLDRTIENALEICEDNQITLVAAAVDFGDKQDELERWVQDSAYGDLVHPVKGVGEDQAKGMGKGQVVTKQKNDVPGVYHLRKQPGGWTLMFVDGDSVRHKVQDAYRLPSD